MAYTPLDPGVRATTARAAHVRLVQVLEVADLGLTSIDGLAFGDSHLLASGATPGGDVLAAVSPLGAVSWTSTLPAGLRGASGLAYDQQVGELVAGRADRVVRVPTRGGQPTGSVRDVGSAAGAAGIAMSAGGAVLALEASPLRVVDLGDGTAVSLQGVTGPLAGLAATADGHLFTVSATGSTIYEFAADGTLAATRDIRDAGLSAPVDVELAPSADPTDDAGKLSLFVADATTGIAEFELAATPLAAVMLDAGTATAALVNTIEGAALTPDSPDPSGITYHNGIDRLVVTSFAQ